MSMSIVATVKNEFNGIPLGARLSLFAGLFASYIFLPSQNVFIDNSSAVKTALITGASQGLGRQLALEFCRQGSHVLLTAMDLNELKQVATDCRSFGNKNVQLFAVDLETRDGVSQLIDFTNEHISVGERLDFLLLNHMAEMKHSLWNSTDEDYDYLERVFNVNFFAYANVFRRLRAPLEKAGGRVVVMTSVAGVHPSPFFAPYSATKAAVISFFGGLRQELAISKSPISITTCVLGLLDTPSGRMFYTEKVNSRVKMPRADLNHTASVVIEAALLRKPLLFHPWIAARGYTLLAGLPFGATIIDFIYANHLT